MEQEVKDILKKAQDGDEAAFNEMVKRYEQSVFIKANQICRNEADAKDAVQETFIEVHRSLKNMRDLNSFYSWLMVVTASKCNINYRKLRHIVQNHVPTKEQINQSETRYYMDPSRYAHYQSEKKILTSIIQSLTPKQAQIIDMIYLKEMKLTEIAEVLQIPLGTVKTRSLRAREELKKKIEEYERVEGRRLHFYADVATPVVGLGLTKQITSSISKKVMGSMNYLTQHTLVSSCIVSLTIVTATCGILSQSSKIQDTIDQDLHMPISETAPNTSEVISLTFTPITYNGKEITTFREAYFTCMNFAQDEASMKTKSKEEINEIKPLYEQLKQANSPFYETLKIKNWDSYFEAMLG